MLPSQRIHVTVTRCERFPVGYLDDLSFLPISYSHNVRQSFIARRLRESATNFGTTDHLLPLRKENFATLTFALFPSLVAIIMLASEREV